MSMRLIQTVTVGSGGVGSITITGIPQTFDDLLVLVSSRSSSSFIPPDLYVLPNADVSNLTSWRRLRGDGSGVTTFGTTNVSYPSSAITSGALATSNTFGSASFYFANYRLSAAKSWSSDSVSENNEPTSVQMIGSNVWNSTTAITSLFFATTNDFVQHSTFSLYGITRA